MAAATETKISVANIRPGMTIRITEVLDDVPDWEQRSTLDPMSGFYISPERVAALIADDLRKFRTTNYLRTGQVKRSGEVVTVAGVDFSIPPDRVMGTRDTPQALITLTDGRQFRSSTRQRVVLIDAA
ncbi:MAG: hypothetical protein ACOYOQ_14300 [Microthrixaceae bacterium]